MAPRNLTRKMKDETVSQRELELVPPVPISYRKCTDCLFLIIFILYCIGILIIGGIAFENGNPNRLVYGSDYLGRVCGEGNKSGEPYLVYPRVYQDVVEAGTALSVDFFALCASTCPVGGQVVCDDTGAALVAALMSSKNASYFDITEACLNNDGLDAGCYNSLIYSHCWETLFNTTSVLFHCFPQFYYNVSLLPQSGCEVQRNISGVTKCLVYKQFTETVTSQPTGTDVLFSSFNSLTSTLQKYIADVVKAWPVILVSGIAFAAAVGLIYILSLWLFVGLIVWFSILAVQVSAVLFTVYLYIKAGIITVSEISAATNQIDSSIAGLETTLTGLTGISFINASIADVNGTAILIKKGALLPVSLSSSASYQTEYQYGAYVMTAITVLLFFLILLLGRRINRAIAIFREASSAIRATPCLILLPFVTVPCLMLVIAYWAASTAYIASAGSYTIKQLNYTAPVSPSEGAFTIYVFGTFDYTEVFIAYNFLGFLWVSNFITAISVYTIAGTVGHWYWKGSETNEAGSGSSPLLRSIYVVFRFHLGTAAFGAILVAIIQFVRYLAAYLETHSKAAQKKSRIMAAVMCCVNCCLKCLEYCIKFISRNAYIISALYGESFCASTRQAFYTITANLAQVALVTFLGDLILRFGQVLITVCAAFACWAYLDNTPEYGFGGSKELNTLWFPSFLSGVLGYFVAYECLSIYDITVDTLLMSFCQDQKLKKHLEAKHPHELKQSKSMANFIKKAKHDDIADIEGEDVTDRRQSVDHVMDG